MAVRILLDHGVPEDHIIFITFLVAREGGIVVLKRAFPGVKIVCGAVDDEMQEVWLEGYKGEGNPEGKGRQVWVMKPGMGQIGMVLRYGFHLHLVDILLQVIVITYSSGLYASCLLRMVLRTRVY